LSKGYLLVDKPNLYKIPAYKEVVNLLAIPIYNTIPVVQYQIPVCLFMFIVISQLFLAGAVVLNGLQDLYQNNFTTAIHYYTTSIKRIFTKITIVSSYFPMIHWCITHLYLTSNRNLKNISIYFLSFHSCLTYIYKDILQIKEF